MSDTDRSGSSAQQQKPWRRVIGGIPGGHPLYEAGTGTAYRSIVGRMADFNAVPSHKSVWDESAVDRNGDRIAQFHASSQLVIQNSSSVLPGYIVPNVYYEIVVGSSANPVVVTPTYSGPGTSHSDELLSLSHESFSQGLSAQYGGSVGGIANSATNKALSAGNARAFREIVQGSSFTKLWDLVVSNALTLIANNELQLTGAGRVEFAVGVTPFDVLINSMDYMNTIQERMARIAGGTEILLEVTQNDASVAEVINLLLKGGPGNFQTNIGFGGEGIRADLQHWRLLCEPINVTVCKLDYTGAGFGVGATFSNAAPVGPSGTGWYGLAPGAVVPPGTPVPVYTGDMILQALDVISRAASSAEDMQSSIELYAGFVASTTMCQLRPGNGTKEAHTNAFMLEGVIHRPKAGHGKSLFQRLRTDGVDEKQRALSISLASGPLSELRGWYIAYSMFALAAQMSWRESGATPESLIPFNTTFALAAGAVVATRVNIKAAHESLLRCGPGQNDPAPASELLAVYFRLLFGIEITAATRLLGFGSIEPSAVVPIATNVLSMGQAVSTIPIWFLPPNTVDIRVRAFAGVECDGNGGGLGAGLEEGEVCLYEEILVTNGTSNSSVTGTGAEIVAARGGPGMLGHGAFLLRVDGSAEGDAYVSGKLIGASDEVDRHVLASHTLYMGRTSANLTIPNTAARGALYGGRLLLDTDEARLRDYQLRLTGTTAQAAQAIVRGHVHTHVGLRYLQWAARSMDETRVVRVTHPLRKRLRIGTADP